MEIKRPINTIFFKNMSEKLQLSVYLVDTFFDGIKDSINL